MHRFLTLILTAALLLVAPSRALASKADVEGALAYVPRDSFAVVTANLEDVKRSMVFSMAKQAFLAEEKKAKDKLAELKQKTGFDVWRDAHAIVMAFGKDFAKDDDQFVAVIHATVQQKRLIDFIEKTGDAVEEKKSAQGSYYLLGRRQEGALAFRGDFVILAGAKVMPKVLQRQGLGPKVKSLLAPYKTRDIAVAMEVIPDVAKKLAREDEMFKSTKAVAAGLDVKSGADLGIDATFGNAQVPRKLAQMANQGLAEAKQDKSVKQMGLDRFLSKITVRSVGTKLRADAKLSNADLKKLDQVLRRLLF